MGTFMKVSSTGMTKVYFRNDVNMTGRAFINRNTSFRMRRASTVSGDVIINSTAQAFFDLAGAVNGNVICSSDLPGLSLGWRWGHHPLEQLAGSSAA